MKKWESEKGILRWSGCSVKMVGFVLVYLRRKENVKARKIIFQAGRIVWANSNAGEGLAEDEETWQLGTKDSCRTRGWKGGFETENPSGSGESLRVLSSRSDARNTGLEEDQSGGGRQDTLPGRKCGSHVASRLPHRSKCQSCLSLIPSKQSVSSFKTETTVSRYNSQTIRFTHLKHGIKCFWVQSHGCRNITII